MSGISCAHVQHQQYFLLSRHQRIQQSGHQRSDFVNAVSPSINGPCIQSILHIIRQPGRAHYPPLSCILIAPRPSRKPIRDRFLEVFWGCACLTGATKNQLTVRDLHAMVVPTTSCRIRRQAQWYWGSLKVYGCSRWCYAWCHRTIIPLMQALDNKTFIKLLEV